MNIKLSQQEVEDIRKSNLFTMQSIDYAKKKSEADKQLADRLESINNRLMDLLDGN